jgi:hypothetical protein
MFGQEKKVEINHYKTTSFDSLSNKCFLLFPRTDYALQNVWNCIFLFGILHMFMYDVAVCFELF